MVLTEVVGEPKVFQIVNVAEIHPVYSTVHHHPILWCCISGVTDREMQLRLIPTNRL